MEQVYIFFSTIIELFRYLLIFTGVFNYKLKPAKTPYIIMFTLCVFSTILFHNSNFWIFFTYVTGVIIPFMCIYGNPKETLPLYLLTIIELSILDSMIAYTSIIICGYSMSDIINILYSDLYNISAADFIYYLFAPVVTLIVLVVININAKSKSRPKIVLSICQLFIFIFGNLLCLLLFSLIQSISHNTNLSKKLEIMSYILSLSICVIFIMLCIQQVITYDKKKYYKHKSKSYMEYLNIQKNHITNTLRNEEQLRRFKHDLQYHITAIKKLIAEEQTKELYDYINHIEKDLKKHETINISGNSVIDSIISGIMENTKQKDIHLKWTGKILSDTKVDIYDLCIIFANTLSNAVEACEKLVIEKKEIFVNVYNYQNKLFINIINPINKNIEISSNKFIYTIKEDKNCHGYGTINVYETVKKYNGIINYTCKNKVFEVSIVI